MKVKKAIFPIAGLGTRFLPESKVVNKELIPLADRPLLDYNVKEAYLSGIEDITFIARAKQRGALDYYEQDEKLKEILISNNKKRELTRLNEIELIAEKISFSSILQKNPTGDANALFGARDIIGDDPFGVFFCDDIIDAKVPLFKQLQEVFLTCNRPVLALKKMPADRLPNYGVVNVEKIANRFYKIKSVSQKPSIDAAPSDLAIIGRMILTPDVLEYLGKNKESREKDRSVTQALGEMAELGKAIYGYEIEGDWLECGDIISWYKSFVKMALKDEYNGEQFKAFLKDLRL